MENEFEIEYGSAEYMDEYNDYCEFCQEPIHQCVCIWDSEDDDEDDNTEWEGGDTVYFGFDDDDYDGEQ